MTRYVIADAAAYVLDSDPAGDPIAYAARMPSGDIRLLEGSAGLLWHTVVDRAGAGGVSAAEILAALTAEAEIEPDELAGVVAGVAAFLRAMVGEGLIVTR